MPLNQPESDSDGEASPLRRQLREKLDQMEEVGKRLLDQAKNVADEKAELVKAMGLDAKELLKEKLRDLGERKLDQGLGGLKVKVAHASKDPQMPMFVQRAVDEVVDTVWPEVQDEIRTILLSLVLSSRVHRRSSKLPVCCDGTCCAPCSCLGLLLAKLRYFIFPFDKSFWRQMRDPFYAIYKIITLIPVYGVPQAIYLLQLFIIDRQDEYQLTTFILTFKATLFVSVGVVGAAVAMLTFYLCIQDLEGKDEPEHCSETAPTEPVYLAGLFLLQVVMVWVAFLYIPGSSKKGGEYYQTMVAREQREKDGQRVSAAQRERESIREQRLKTEDEKARVVRKRLQKFLYYELFVSVLCVAILAYAAFEGAGSQRGRITRDAHNWRLLTTVYMVKVFYGLASFPFLFLNLPVIGALITHAKPTGYTRMGECVPYAPATELPAAVAGQQGDTQWAQSRPPPAGAGA